MSEVTNVLQTTNQLITNYDVSKFLLGFNSFINGSVEADGADVDLVQGMVMGRVSADGLLTPLVATATDGSQYPVGICIIDQTVTDGDTDAVQLVNKGKLALEKISFLGAETLATVVSGRQLTDWLNDLGMMLPDAEELTKIDNQ